MNDLVAALPMYDWPELPLPMDALWTAIAHELRLSNLPAPAQLARELPYDAAWVRPDLLLGQTCGLPLATTLAGKVSLVGTFDLGLENCPFGHYRSALMVRADSTVQTLTDARAQRLVINNLDSHSGFHSVMELLPASEDRFFSSVVVTGAHRLSLDALLCGRADIAAVDCHSLMLARRYGPSTEQLRIIGYTRAVPGTPLITAQHDHARDITDAVENSLTKVDNSISNTLGIAGLWRCADTDYAPMASVDVARIAQRELAPTMASVG